MVKKIVNVHTTGYKNTGEMVLNASSSSVNAALNMEERFFMGSTLQIYTGSGSSGTLLTLDTDYILGKLNDNLSSAAGSIVYGGIYIINSDYFDVDLYIPNNSLTIFGDYIDAEDINSEVDTIAELRTISGVIDGQKMIVNGYDERGDVSDMPSYFWHKDNAESDDGGAIIQVDGILLGRWVASISNMSNVKWFGAKGDWDISEEAGTDDHASIQAAINYAAGRNLKVYFPEGYYRVTQSLDCGVDNDVFLMGDSRYGNQTVDILADNETPFNLIESPGTIEGIRLRSKQDKIHIGVVGRYYNGLFRYVDINGFDYGFKASGVFVSWEYVVINRCNTAIQGHYLEEGQYRDSTMFRIFNCSLNNGDIGFNAKETYLDPDNNFDEVAVEASVDGLLNMKVEGTGFESNRIGFTTETNIWDLTLLNCWTEANSESGIDLTKDNSRAEIINCRANAGDVWLYPSNTEYAKTAFLSQGRHTVPDQRRYWKGIRVRTPVIVHFAGDTSDLSIKKGSELFESFTESSYREWKIDLKQSARYGAITVTGITRVSELICTYRLDNTNTASDVGDYGIFNRIFMNFYEKSDLTTPIEPEFIALTLSCDYEDLYD